MWRGHWYLNREPTKAEIIMWGLTRIAAQQNQPEYTHRQSWPLTAPETKALARLVGKHGKAVTIAAIKAAALPRRGRPPRAKLPALTKPLTLSNTKALARLIGKCGRRTIVAAAKAIPLPRRGRPSRGSLPRFERVQLTEQIDELAEQHRKAGSRKPYQDAEIDVYEIQFYGAKKRPRLLKFLKTVRRKRLQGRRELYAAREAAQRLRAQKRPRK
jgi:hypothetical protein